MNHFIKGIVAVAFTLIVNAAHAGIINFISLTEAAGAYGEGAWSSLNLASGGAKVSISGHASDDNDPTQYAYLDWGTAGLGSCKDVVNAAKVNTVNSGSSANNCSPSSDDNVTKKEFLRFIFDANVVITNIWFNNNHDGGFSSGDKVRVDGKVMSVATGYAGDTNGIGSFAVAAGHAFDVDYVNEQFYISAIEFAAVPESSALMLLSIGLLMVFGLRRRRR